MVIGEFSAKKASDAKLWCFFICTWINCWVKNCEAGDMRRHRAHYDVILMWLCPSKLCLPLDLSFLYLFKCFYIWQRIMKINHESVWDLNLIITNLYMDITRHRRAPNCGITAGSSHKRVLCPLWNFQLGLAPIWSYGIFFLANFFFLIQQDTYLNFKWSVTSKVVYSEQSCYQ